MVNPWHFDDISTCEIGVDEVGRGPMFGRVYTAAVVLPKDTETFDYSKMKDSKKFTSKKKISEVAEYIKKHALYWCVTYETEEMIDKVNIRQATFNSMHKSISGVLEKMPADEKENVFLLVDGNDFRSYSVMKDDNMIVYPHECFKGGDNLYGAIAAASILAKVERDQYILDLCEEYPKLKEYYSLDSNKGYGAKKHLEGIAKYGITKWHRRSFGICKTTNLIHI